MPLDNLQTNFTVLDWCIVCGYILVIVGIGVYVKKYVASAADFIVAGRGLRTYLAIATMIGTELGLSTVVYSAQKGFTGGFAAFHIALTAAIVTLVVGLSGFIVVPLRRMGVMTIPEFYQNRFGRGVRLLGGAILVFSGIVNMGMFIKAGSIFITAITGLNDPVYLNIVMVVLLGLVLLYTALGGMVSVVILDYFQFVILSFGLLAATVFSVKYLGWEHILESVSQQRGEAGMNPFHGEVFGPAYVIWMLFLGLVGCAVWQTSVIRACSAENIRVVKRLYIWSSIGFLIRFLIPCFLGVCALTYIAGQPDLKSYFLPDVVANPEKHVEITMKAMPLYLSQVLPAGFIGIISAGMLAAFMSSGDSYLLCWSSVLAQDVVAPWFKKGLSSKTRLLLARIFVVVIGIFILVWGLRYPLRQDLWDYMAISGALYFTGAIPILVLGLYWKRASRTGAYMSLFAGLLSLLGLKPFQDAFGFVLNPIKLHFGFTKTVPVEEFTESMMMVKDIPIEQVTTETVEIYRAIPSHIIGLCAIMLAAVLMVAGSMLFPQKSRGNSAGE